MIILNCITVTGNSSREKRKRVKKNPKPVPQASLHSSCYVGSVSASSLKHNKLVNTKLWFIPLFVYLYALCV